MNTSLLIDIWSGIAVLLLIHVIHIMRKTHRSPAAREKIAHRMVTYVLLHYCGFIISLKVILLVDANFIRYCWLAIPGLVGIPVVLWFSRKSPMKLVRLVQVIDMYYPHWSLKESDFPTIKNHRILQNFFNFLFVVGFFLIAIFYGLAIILFLRN